MDHLATFKSVNQAIKAENALLKLNLDITVMPLPAEIRAGCGICLRIRRHEMPQAVEALQAADIEDPVFYTISGGPRIFTYERM